MDQLAIFEKWFQDFTIDRILDNESSKIDGRPLYGYQVTSEELDNLKKIFRSYYRGLSSNSKLNRYYGATFVLLGSEFFRRYYERQWSWDVIYQFIGVSVDLPDRVVLIDEGFKFWKLPKIEAVKGKKRDFLGAVMNQGGLPWRLVQDSNDNFGKVIQICFNKYVELTKKYGSLIPEIQSLAKQYRFPDYLSGQLTFDLIAGVVETIITLQRKYPDIVLIADPFKYLSEREPDWVSKFPIPLDEENAQGLLKSWFANAKKQIDQGEKAKENIENFFIAQNYWCKDFDTDDLPNGLETKVIQPNILTISSNKIISKPTSLRLELMIYEGESVLIKGRYFYAEMNETQDLIIKSHVNSNSFSLKRRQPYKSLTVKLVSAGVVIYEEIIIGSNLSEEGMPLYFIKADDHYQCISDAGSFRTAHIKGYLYLPKEFVIENIAEVSLKDDEIQVNYRLLYEGDKASWLEILNIINVTRKQDFELFEFSYEANSKHPNKEIYLDGEKDINLQGSRYIYRSFPILRNAPADVVEYVNGQVLSQNERNKIIGNVNYQAKTKAGRIVFMKRFAILPASIRISTDIIRLNNPQLTTRLYLVNQVPNDSLSNIHFSVVDDNSAMVVTKNSCNDFTIDILDHNRIPSDICIAIDSTHHHDPLILNIPLSVVGMRIQKDHFFLPENTLTLSLDQMAGYDIVLQDVQNITRVNIEIQLHSKRYHSDRMKLVTQHTIKSSSPSMRLNLISFKDEIERLMSIIDDLDAYITILIKSSNLGDIEITLCKFHINGSVSPFNALLPELVLKLNGVVEKDLGRMGFSWISLLQPSEQKSLTILRTKPTAYDNEINIYFNETLEKEALGLITSDMGSELTLRPILVENKNFLEKLSPEKNSIQYAVAHFNPATNVQAFNNVFQLMMEDLDHPGWDYFQDLVESVPSNLSLSTFAAWKSLARNLELLTISFFRLKLNTVFCHRIRDELSIIWEAIPYYFWHSAVTRYSNYILDKYGAGLNEEDLHKFLLNVLLNCNSKLKNLLPASEVMLNAIHGERKKNLMTEEALSKIRTSKNSLVLNNTENIWPTYLQDELITWFESDIYSKGLLSDPFLNVLIANDEPNYHYSSLLLPVYMAAVSTGVSKFGDIVDYQRSDIEILSGTTFEMLVELKFAYQQLKSFDHHWYNTCYYYSVIEFMGWA